MRTSPDIRTSFSLPAAPPQTDEERAMLKTEAEAFLNSSKNSNSSLILEPNQILGTVEPEAGKRHIRIGRPDIIRKGMLRIDLPVYLRAKPQQ